MNEKVKQAFKFLCEQYVKDLNRYENKEIAKDYFYNPKYECGFKINGENVYFADILKAFDNMEELIKSKDEYIAKLIDENKKLKGWNKYYAEQLNDCKEELKQAHKETENEQFANIKNEQELKDLQEFARIMASRRLINPRLQDSSVMFYDVEKRHSETEFNLVERVVDKYGKKED